MLSPKLRHRVDIEERTEGLDSEGRQEENWDSILTSEESGQLLPAAIVPLSGREFVAAQAVQAGVTTRITIRWRAGITAAMRVVHGADVYNIKAVLPDPTLRQHLALMCEVGVNEG
jgi:SPP1 family predicted phage head-tail adaptor